MHVFDAELEPGDLAVVWSHRGQSAAVYGLASDEALWLVETLGVLTGDGALADGVRDRLTSLLEPSAMVLSDGDEHAITLLRAWRAPGAPVTDEPHLTAVTDQLFFPVVHADVLAAERFTRAEERGRPALRGTWRGFYAERAPRDWQTSTRIERLVREATGDGLATV